jgi:hypothetical protein
LMIKILFYIRYTIFCTILKCLRYSYVTLEWFSNSFCRVIGLKIHTFPPSCTYTVKVIYFIAPYNLDGKKKIGLEGKEGLEKRTVYRI